MVDDKVTNLLEWCRREREYLQMQREMLEIWHISHFQPG